METGCMLKLGNAETRDEGQGKREEETDVLVTDHPES